MRINDYDFGQPFETTLTHAAVDLDRSKYRVPDSVEHQEDDDYSSELPPYWTPLAGHSGQHDYAGPVMHESEFIGGGLEDWLLEHKGIYVTVTVDETREEESYLGEPMLETESIGWMILRFTPTE